MQRIAPSEYEGSAPVGMQLQGIRDRHMLHAFPQRPIGERPGGSRRQQGRRQHFPSNRALCDAREDRRLVRRDDDAVDIRVEDLVSGRQRAVDPGGAVKRDRCDVRAGNSVVEGVDVPK